MGETDDLRSVVDALLERVRILEDQLALAQVVASYGPAVDSGSSERAASLWSRGGVFDVPPYATWAGRDEIAGMVDGAGHQGLITNGCGHVLTAPRLVVDGDDARGWNYALEHPLGCCAGTVLDRAVVRERVDVSAGTRWMEDAPPRQREPRRKRTGACPVPRCRRRVIVGTPSQLLDLGHLGIRANDVGELNEAGPEGTLGRRVPGDGS